MMKSAMIATVLAVTAFGIAEAGTLKMEIWNNDVRSALLDR
jgi:hypothetical protein